ncbi:DUF1501 domain-containing protein [Cystobacter fuscus]
MLVTLFLRGGADGLSLVAPVGDADYVRLRPNIALRATGEHAALRLDDTFGLHPGLAALMPQWSNGTLAVVHAVGLPQAMRSHFDAQDFVETGTPGVKSTREGYLNRVLAQLPPGAGECLSRRGDPGHPAAGARGHGSGPVAGDAGGLPAARPPTRRHLRVPLCRSGGRGPAHHGRRGERGARAGAG